MDDRLSIERRSLTASKWANLFMAGAGVGAGLMANADALLLDGVFSGLNVLMAIAAARVALSASRPPDASRPFGYEIDESVFVMFRGLMLLGIVGMALISALKRIGAYWLTGEATPVVMGWITAYVGLMILVCAGLYLYHRRNWLRTDRTSVLLRTECKAALVDGLLSLGAGVAFVAIGLLKGTALEPLVPISDSIVVVVLCLAILPQPIGIFRDALGQVLGVSLPAQAVANIRSEAMQLLADGPFEVLHVAAVPTGRMTFYLVYLKPLGPVIATDIEQARARLHTAAKPDRLELVLASTPPFRET